MSTILPKSAAACPATQTKQTARGRARALGLWGWIMAFAIALAGGGCAGTKGKSAEPRKPSSARPGAKPFTVTPSNVLTGRILTSKPNMRFVVLVFPVGQMPALDQRMAVYRGGLKTGEVRICGPQRDDKIVADLLAGEAAEGDEVRSQ